MSHTTPRRTISEAGSFRANVDRVLYDAVDHYLDVLIRDVRDGGAVGARARGDILIAETILGKIDPTCFAAD